MGKLYDFYFENYYELKKKYGENIVFLCQVGSFFELYSYFEEDITNLSTISKVCDLMKNDTSSKKNNGKQISFSGFQKLYLDKYIRKLINNNYIVIVMEQTGIIGKNDLEIREITGVYSYGTYFENEKESLNNNIMCAWIYKNNLGLSSIDIITGKSIIFECENYIEDELLKYLSVYNPNELFIISDQKLNLNIDYINYYNCDQRIKNCEKQIYQNEILEKFFNKTLDEIFILNPIATQSLCYLLDFISQRKLVRLIKGIKIPVFQNLTSRLILANHSLKQLNIINNQSKDKNTSILNLFNECKTNMGKRKFKENLLNPSNNYDWIKNEYDIIEHILINNNYQIIRKKLSRMKDLNKLYRRFNIMKCEKNHILMVYEDIKIINEISSYFQDDKFLKCNQNIKKEIQKIINEINLFFNFNEINHSFQFINYNYDQNLDELRNIYKNEKNKLNIIIDKLNNIIDNKNSKGNKNYIKFEVTEKKNYRLITTETRAKCIKDNKEFIIKKQSSKTIITNEEIENIFNNLNYYEEKIFKSINNITDNFIKKLLNYDFEIIIEYISNIDLWINKAHISKKYNLSKPIIHNSLDSNVNFIKLRHPLIESILKDEIYVPNDIYFNQNRYGMLLYGTNAVGKSSLIKSIGIAIIMAQAGLYVSCEKMEYSPYKKLFTRILSNDNLFKGLSTFGVEMLEFKHILLEADKNSIIIGDELCSGTETPSAISIFTAGINFLYNQKCSFIFATHLHEINNLKQIKEKDKLTLNHLSVIYNKELDSLVYDRILHDGPGDNMYGLEVCKGLHLPKKFLDDAYNIRNKLNQNNKSILDYKISKYNSKKIKGICEICKNNMSSEIHHLQHQKDANKNGFINNFHKNSLGNLLSVCEECHKKLHKDSKKGHVKKLIIPLN